MIDDCVVFWGLFVFGVLFIWVFMGDLIMYGFIYICGVWNYVDYLYEFICGDLGCVQDVVINIVIIGWWVDLILDDFDCCVVYWWLDVVILMIGMNDCIMQWLDLVIEIVDFVLLVMDFVCWVCVLEVVLVLQMLFIVDFWYVLDCVRIGEFVQVIWDVFMWEGVIFVDQFVVFVEFFVGIGFGNDDIVWGLFDDVFYFGVVGYVFFVFGFVEEFGFDILDFCVCMDFVVCVVLVWYFVWFFV